jgi:uncharacterized membrane protein
MVALGALHPLWLVLIALFPLVYLLWRRYPPPLSRQRSLVSLLARLLMLTLLVLALAGMRVTTPSPHRALIAVVDLSASTRDFQDSEAGAVRELISAKAPGDLFGLVTLGHRPTVELAPTRTPSFKGFGSAPDPNYTDIAAALRLAAGLVPMGYAGQLVLISDGRQNVGDAVATAAELRADGVRIDVLPTGGPPPADSMILGVDAPSEVHGGQTVSLTVRLQATVEAGGLLTVEVDGKELTSRGVSLPAGPSSQTFDLPQLDAGLHRVRAHLSVTPDTFAENDVGQAELHVLGQPSILILEGSAGEGVNLERALTAAGMRVERKPADQAPTDTPTLARYDSVAVVDATAQSLSDPGMTAIADSVRTLGRGLVAVGGPQSYGPGGWRNTPLEQALPVLAETPKRRPPVAVVLVMESMESPGADQVALGAAQSVIDQLGPQDEVGVTDGNSGFVVNLHAVTDRKAIDDKIRTSVLGDPPSYTPFIRMAGDALKKSKAPLKHIVVLGDGDARLVDVMSGQDPATLQNLLVGLNRGGITTSAVGIDTHGQPSDIAFMQDIARWGGGSFYGSPNAARVPQLLLTDSHAALQLWFQQQPFFPEVTANGDLLLGVPLHAFPELGGYVTTTAKPGAEVYLSSPQQDPVLAAWSYGLGRSVAWTSDASGRWTSGFLRSQTSATLFAQMVNWTLPVQGSSGLSIDARPTGDMIELTVTGPDYAVGTLQVGIEDPDLRSTLAQLRPVAAGQWRGQFPANTVGTYLLHATVQASGRPPVTADSAVVVPYSPEYLNLGRDARLLSEVARAGGKLLTTSAAAWSVPVQPASVSFDLFWPLLLAAVLLWPFDIALRRVTLTPSQLVAGMRARRRASR